MNQLHVTFFYPDHEDLVRFRTFDLNSSEPWLGAKSRRRAWVVQTYLRLRRAGYDVSISADIPNHGILVVLAEGDFKQAFVRQFRRPNRQLFVLSIRADVEGFRTPFADAEIVQNGRFADDQRVFFIPHWPQPCLIPRDAARGDTIRTISFKGRPGSLRQEFHSERFVRFLNENDLVLDEAVPRDGVQPAWHNYSTTDLVLAVRPDWSSSKLRCEKPASKLVNAWHAGAPALVGPEYAFRELRRSSLDFIEVDSVDETMAAISKLTSQPRLYTAMVENGRIRAREFTPARITAQWAEVLFERLPEIASQRGFKLSRTIPLYARSVLNVLMMPPTTLELRKQAGQLLRQTTKRIRSRRIPRNMPA
ncbi:MAG TPA: hypothetical protein VFG50_01540 [Rhodothermales bacterium]|nr:hypothetical protein [Rhodothermales bacterium]